MLARWMSKIRILWDILATIFLRRPFFGRIGHRSYIRKPRSLVSPRYVFIGDRTRIHEDATLYAVRRYGTESHSGRICIGNNVFLNYGVNLTAADEMVIEDDVTFGWNVSIIDFDHDFSRKRGSVIDAPLRVRGATRICSGTWVGANSMIRGGIRIGRDCVIAANSVVLHDVPDGYIVGGNPAKLLRPVTKENA